MNHDEYRITVMNVAYLASCAVNGIIPDVARVERMDLEALFKAAERHLLTAITAMALESAGVKNAAFIQAKGKAIRKAAAFDIERAIVLQKLEEAGIWYMPLKGSIIKEFYPKLGMRQMADNDILYDSSRTPEVKKLMEGLGFSTDKDYGRGVHDIFLKPPVCNFEMHHKLFDYPHDKKIVEYYRDVLDRLLLKENSSYGYHFSDEDFYIYMLAHEYKHYAEGGTGLRSVLDIYVYLKKKEDVLDRAYLDREFDKLGIAEFEAQNRSLARHLFDGNELTEQDQAMLEYMLSSGTYGTVQNRVQNKLNKYGNGFWGKVKYVFSRLFLPMSVVRSVFPVFARYPVLLPFLPFYRLLRGWIINRDKVRTELRMLKKG